MHFNGDNFELYDSSDDSLSHSENSEIAKLLKLDTAILKINIYKLMLYIL